MKWYIDGFSYLMYLGSEFPHCHIVGSWGVRPSLASFPPREGVQMVAPWLLISRPHQSLYFSHSLFLHTQQLTLQGHTRPLLSLQPLPAIFPEPFLPTCPRWHSPYWEGAALSGRSCLHFFCPPQQWNAPQIGQTAAAATLLSSGGGDSFSKAAKGQLSERAIGAEEAEWEALDLPVARDSRTSSYNLHYDNCLFYQIALKWQFLFTVHIYNWFWMAHILKCNDLAKETLKFPEDIKPSSGEPEDIIKKINGWNKIL